MADGDPFINIANLGPRSSIVGSDIIHIRSTGGIDSKMTITNLFNGIPVPMSIAGNITQTSGVTNLKSTTMNGITTFNNALGGARFILDVEDPSSGQIIQKAQFNNQGYFTFQTITGGFTLTRFEIVNAGRSLFGGAIDDTINIVQVLGSSSFSGEVTINGLVTQRTIALGSRFTRNVETGVAGQVLYRATFNNNGSHVFQTVIDGVDIDGFEIKNDGTSSWNRTIAGSNRFILDVINSTDGIVIHKATLNNNGKHLFQTIDDGVTTTALTMQNNGNCDFGFHIIPTLNPTETTITQTTNGETDFIPQGRYKLSNDGSSTLGAGVSLQILIDSNWLEVASNSVVGTRKVLTPHIESNGTDTRVMLTESGVTVSNVRLRQY